MDPAGAGACRALGPFRWEIGTCQRHVPAIDTRLDPVLVADIKIGRGVGPHAGGDSVLSDTQSTQV